jgi:hypothetical protein
MWGICLAEELPYSQKVFCFMILAKPLSLQVNCPCCVKPYGAASSSRVRWDQIHYKFLPDQLSTNTDPKATVALNNKPHFVLIKPAFLKTFGNVNLLRSLITSADPLPKMISTPWPPNKFAVAFNMHFFKQKY